jgi:hypothetical protein
VGFEPTTPAFERAKTFHTIDRTVTPSVHSEEQTKDPIWSAIGLTSEGDVNCVWEHRI